MGNSSGAQPTFRIELNQSRWLAGETVSGRVIIEESSKKRRNQAAKIECLRIQFRGEERVSMGVSRLVQRPTSSGITVESAVTSSRRTESLTPRSHEEEVSCGLREPLLDRGYARVTVEADQATSGPPSSRRGRQDRGNNRHPRRPMQQRDHSQHASVESSSTSTGRSHDSSLQSRNSPHRDPLEAPHSHNGNHGRSPLDRRSRSENTARGRSDSTQSPTRVDSTTSRRDARTQSLAQRREALARSSAMRREQRAQRRQHRSQPLPAQAAVPADSARPHQRPEVSHRPSYREEHYTDTASHIIFEADALLVNLDGTNEDSSYYPFGWTLPSDAPSSFRWKNGTSSAQIDYSVIIYAVTECGDTVGRTKHPFYVDALSSPELLIAEPQDLPVLGCCCSNKGVVRMELRAPSNTAVGGHRFPVDIDVDGSACRRRVVTCQVGLSETVRIRTSNGSEKRYSNQIINLSTTRYNRGTVGLAVPSSVLPTYNGRWVDVKHGLSVTAVTAGCCTNNPAITTTVTVATKESSPSSSSVLSMTPAETAATTGEPASVVQGISSPPMATVIPEATVVTVVSDEETTTDDKALSQPPDTSRQFHPTAPDESMVD